MPRIGSEWAAAGAPRDKVVHISVQLASASRQGRALVAGVSQSQAQSQARSQAQSPLGGEGQSRPPPPISRQQPSRAVPSRAVPGRAESGQESPEVLC